MKRIGLFLLAVVMVAGLAGCPSKDHESDFDPTGTWTRNVQWYCTGSSWPFVWHIFSNGTVEDYYLELSGKWSVDADVLVITFGHLVYTGTINGDRVAGRMYQSANGDWGCFTAYRTSTTP